MWVWKRRVRLLVIFVDVVGIPVRKGAIGHDEIGVRVIG